MTTVREHDDEGVFLDGQPVGSLELSVSLDHGQPVGKQRRHLLVEELLELLLGDGADRLRSPEEQLGPDERQRVAALAVRRPAARC